MRLVSTKHIKPGATLGQTIYNDNGMILLQKEMCLSENILQRLIDQGITYVYIEDDETKDINVEPAISEKLRKEATESVREIFSEIKSDDLLSNSFILDKEEKGLMAIVNRLMEEINHHEESISLLADIFLTDDYIFQHSLNVTIYSLAIGSALNLSKKELSELGTGAILHDIGKAFIDPVVLQKPNKLTDEEFALMKEHTTIGFDLLRKQSSVSSVVAHCAYQHHERLDGSGYPRGLVGDEIHKYAKIIGVADVFDAVTSNRIYRDAMLPHEGLEILYAGAVSLFDKQMVEAFKKSVAVYPNGLTVLLSDGRIGVVIKQNKNLCDRPYIRVIKDKNKQMITPYELDLAKELNITITACNVE
ncbi:HD domain-containing protein [Ornithinibacillus sp. L9]|uniref:HD domain-containing protein n=1 Tax=Ornithinibacillus caprae TaxID=2678566 RepID=A0A6N8FQ12_9BACI|nr:HD-GYP domain-containing protein [Ornithinibacillus caprae]MUK89999.1 HD domain-containing protein [Ornithinibacillus caprae]